MKIHNKLFAYIIVTLLIMNLLFVPTNSSFVSAAPKKLKVSAAKEITLGHSTKIKTNISSTFKSANKKIATVSKKGVVKGKKVGTAKITITAKKNKKLKKTIKIKVKKKKPTTQQATTQRPSTEKPTTERPTTQTPITEKPTTEKPTTEDALTAANVYSAMIAKKSAYPEGMRWTNDNSYAWNGGIYSVGYGCAGFAFILSDAAFGKLPARKIYSFSNIRVGDILRINNDSHSVIVLEVKSNSVIVAEGNYNSSIHWGREIKMSEISSTGSYVMTRYPK